MPQLSVAHNLMLGREPRRFGLVDGARLEAQARAHLDRFGLADRVDPTVPAGGLAAGLQQMFVIVRALSQRARVLVLDEGNSQALAMRARIEIAANDNNRFGI